MMKNVQRALLILLALTISVLAGPANAEVTYFHHDALGSVVAATNESGTVLWREAYQPFGERLDKAVSTDEQAFYYTGKPHDDRIGLTYFGARHYDPVIGRFMGVDPEDVSPDNIHSFNRYAYANNNPYKYVDPDGNSPIDIVFLAYDIGKLGVALYTGQGVGSALLDVGSSLLGVASPVPGMGQALKAGRLAGKISKVTRKTSKVPKGGAGLAADVAGATQPNRIYSARELIRRANEPGPFHNFPESFNREIFENGTRTTTQNFFNKARQGLSNDSIQYRLPGTVNGRDGVFEIFTRPSTSGNTEVIMHRFFQPNP